jgi:hypothetical protein
MSTYYETDCHGILCTWEFRILLNAAFNKYALSNISKFTKRNDIYTFCAQQLHLYKTH